MQVIRPYLDHFTIETTKKDQKSKSKGKKWKKWLTDLLRTRKPVQILSD